MSDSNELNFILRMRDEASSILQAHAAALQGAGNQARGMAAAHKEAADSIKGVMEAAKGAAESLIAMYASNEMIRGAVDAYQEMDRAVREIGRNADMSRESVMALHEELANISMKNGDATVQQMDKLAVAASKMGAHGEDIVKFSVALSKITDDGNLEQVANGVAKILLATDQGVDDVGHFADALAGLSKGARSGIEGITEMTGRLAGLTQGMGISAEHLAAFAREFDNLGGNPMRTAMQFSMVLTQMHQKAEQGGAGLRSLAEHMRMTTDEAKKLVEQHPEEAFEKVLEAVNAIKNSGGDDTTFLKNLGISAAREVRTIEALASRIKDLDKQLTVSDHSDGAADKMSHDMKSEFDRALNEMSTAWTEFKTEIGADAIPILTVAFQALAGVIHTTAETLKDLGPAGKILIDFALFAPGILGVVKAVGLFRTAITGLGSLGAAEGAGLGIMARGVSRLTSALFLAVAALGAYEAGRVVGGAINDAGDRRKQGWGLQDDWDAVVGNTDALQKRKQGEYEAGKFRPHNTAWDGMENQSSSETQRQRARGGSNYADHQASASLQDAHKAAESGSGGGMGQQDIETTIASFVPWVKKLEEVKDLEEKIATARGQMTLNQQQDNKVQLDEADQILAKKKMTPVQVEMQTLNDQIDKAKAITKEQQTQLEIKTKLRDMEQGGELHAGTQDDAEHQAISAGMNAKAAADTAKAYADQMRSLQQEIAATSAITAAQKESASVEKTISDFKEKNAGWTKSEVDNLTAELKVAYELKDVMAAVGETHSQGKAISDYNDKMKALSSIGDTAGMAQLTKDTEAARDPMGHIVTLNDQLVAQLKIGGDYRKEDVETLKQIQALEEKGVQVTEAQKAALQDVNRALSDANKAQTTGFAGWANSIGTMNDQIGKMEQNLASSVSSGLSSGIIGALNGQRYPFAAMGKSIGESMVKGGVDMLMKGGMQATGLDQISGLGTLGGAADKVKSANAALDAANKASGQTGDALKSYQQMSVNATNVYVTGGSGGAAPAGAAGAAPAGGVTPSAAGSVPGVTDGVGSPATSNPNTVQPGAVSPATAAISAPVAGAPPELAAAGAAAGAARTALGAVSGGSGSAAAPMGSVLGPHAAAALSGLGGAPNANTVPPGAVSAATSAVAAATHPDANNPTGLRPPANVGRDVSQDDIVNLAKMNAGEVTKGGDRANQMSMTNWTAMNRAQSNYRGYGSTIESQLSAKIQFSSINGPHGTGTSLADRPMPTEAQLAEARASLSGSDPTHGGTSYLNPLYSGANGRGDGWGGDAFQARARAAGQVSGRGQNTEYFGVAGNDQPVSPYGLNLPGGGPSTGINIGAAKGSLSDPNFGIGNLRGPSTGINIGPATGSPSDPNFGLGNLRGPSSGISFEGSGFSGGNIGFGVGGGGPQPMGAAGRDAFVFGQGGFDSQNMNKAPVDVNLHSQAGVPLTAPNIPVFGGGGLDASTGGLGTGASPFAGLFSQTAALGPGVAPAGQMGAGTSEMLGGGMSLIKMLMGGIGGMHSGGIVGRDRSFTRNISPLAFIGAPRFHDGMGDDEFPAVLQRGERVLTANQDARNSAAMNRLADAVQNRSTPAGTERQDTRRGDTRVNMTVMTRDADSFRSSHSQILAQTHASMARAGAKHN